ncbi:hypothetical protein KIN20_037957 [Parelaphostrongylus tenuis]|uniref:Uncharacterized protein n=1 Tax=Parelaphostrongylus tenuis TaxID=148309 RepID=A0AAD5WM92_PARTN|nr:hypothetical protein KIN20_037957 [Parelaphostrongylus tenuis]
MMPWCGEDAAWQIACYRHPKWLELLQTSLIQSLCKHLGKRRARRLKRGGKRNARLNKGDDEPVVAEIIRVEPIVQNPSDDEPSRRGRRHDDDDNDDDPFGLDIFFVRVYGRSVTIRDQPERKTDFPASPEHRIGADNSFIASRSLVITLTADVVRFKIIEK